MRLQWAGIVGGLVLTVAAQADNSAAPVQRARIEQERAAVEARFRAQEARCSTRFAVTACVDRARAERRNALEPLDRALLALDDAQRKRRAEERLRRIEEKKLEALERERPLEPAPPRAPRRRAEPLLSVNPPSAGSASEPGSTASGPTGTPRSGAAAAYERRQREAAEHRDAVRKRNEERALRRPPAAPLPAPAASGQAGD